MLSANRALRAGASGRASRSRAAAFGRNPPSAPDEPKAARGGPWLEALLSRFGPTTDRAPNLTTLDFEKPLLELDKRIKEVGRRDGAPRGQFWRARSVKKFKGERERKRLLIFPPFARPPPSTLPRAPHCPPQVRKVAEENGVDVSQSIAELETRAQQVRRAFWGRDTD